MVIEGIVLVGIILALGQSANETRMSYLITSFVLRVKT